MPVSNTQTYRQGHLGGRNIFAVVLGNAFEFYDFGVYAAFAVVIGQKFFPSTDPYVSLLLSVAVFGVGFISRPLGGLLLGAYADKHGRKAAMTLTIALMALGTAAIGFLPTYDQIGIAAPALLVLARLVQGFSAGGELGASTVYLYEAAPADRRCLTGSWQLASQGAASIFVGLLGFAITSLLLPEALASWGWRIPFLLSLFIIPVGIYIRRNLNETLEHKTAHATTGSVFKALMRNNFPSLVLGIAAFSGITITQYFLIYLTSFAINTLKMPASTAQLANFAVGIITFVFALIGGWLGDRFGLRAISIIPRALLLLAIYPIVQILIAEPDALTLLGGAALLTAFQAASAALMVLLIARSFPRQVRATGLATAFGLGAALFAGTAQVVFTWLISATGDPIAPVLYVIAMNLVSLLAIYLMPHAEAAEHVSPPPQPADH
ncbi:TPA: MFS transporter [Klebsiella oxytoca]